MDASSANPAVKHNLHEHLSWFLKVSRLLTLLLLLLLLLLACCGV